MSNNVRRFSRSFIPMVCALLMVACSCTACLADEVLARAEDSWTLLAGLPGSAAKDVVYTPAETAAAVTTPAVDVPLKVEAWFQGSPAQLEVGQDVSINLKVSDPAYAYLMDLGTSGEVRVLYPVEPSTSRSLDTTEVVTVPSQAQRLTVTGPAGVEYLLAVASPKALDLAHHRAEFEAVARTAMKLSAKVLDLNPSAVEPRSEKGPDLAGEIESIMAGVAQRHGLRPGENLAWSLKSVKVVDPQGQPPVLAVTVTPAGAEILIDGSKRGATPQTIRDLAPGLHEVLVVQEGYLSYLDRIELQAGQKLTIEAVLKPVK